MVGVFVGAYDALQLEAYDYNCYSEVFSFFMNLADSSKYFDTGIPDKDGLTKALFWVEQGG